LISLAPITIYHGHVVPTDVAARTPHPLEKAMIDDDLTASECATAIGVSIPTIPKILGPATRQRFVHGRPVDAWTRQVVETYAAASVEERKSLRFSELGTRGAPRKEIPVELIATIEELRSQGMSRDLIAKKLNLPLSRIKKSIRVGGLPPVRQGRKTLEENETAVASIPPAPPVVAPAPPMPLIEQAIVLLGLRGVGVVTRDDKGGYKLDGRRITEANILRAAGL